MKLMIYPKRYAFLYLLALAWITPLHAEPLKQTVTKGPVSATLTIEPADITIGDSITATFKVKAEPEIEVIMPSFGEALDQFAILDFTPGEMQLDDGRTQYTQRYTIMPSFSGKQQFPALLVEFIDGRDGQKPAPEGLDAYELLTESVTFEVKSVMKEGAENAQLHPVLGQLEPLPEPMTKSAKNWLWLLLPVVLIVLMAIYLLNRGNTQKQISAYDLAISRLEKLKQSDWRDLDEFFVNLSGIIRRYLEDRYGLRAPELTTEEFLDECAKSPDLKQEHQILLRDLLRQSDLVKFAKAQPSDNVVSDAFEAARHFLIESKVATKDAGELKEAAA